MEAARRRPLGEIGNHARQLDLKQDKPRKNSVASLNALSLSSSNALNASPGFDKAIRDPLYPAEYVKPIMEHCRSSEDRYLPDPTYMARQPEIADRHRAVLIDWLINNHGKQKLHEETLYLCVNIIDRYLSRRTVQKCKVQLLGAVALLVAAKYEEMYPPSVRRIVFLCANAYTRDEVLRMEQSVLNELEFNLTVPTTFHFLRRAMQVGCSGDARVQALCNFCSEMALLDVRMIQYQPSIIGASCVYVANRLSGCKDPWNHNLQYYTKLTEAQLQQCSADLLKIVRTPSFSQCTVVPAKYAKKDVDAASMSRRAADIEL